MARLGVLPNHNRRRGCGLVVASRAVRRVVASVGCCALLVGVVCGCGGGTRQDASEPSGTFQVRVVDASFPSNQSIARSETMRIAVRNMGSKTIPDLAVSLSSFSRVDDQPGLSDSSRPVWVVDRAPVGGDTADVSTWGLGPLRAGATRTFTWKVTPVVPGTHTVKWTVAAGLNGKAKARAANGGRPEGSFTVRVSGKPADASVDPATGAVVRR
jgi:hypothetical protein